MTEPDQKPGMEPGAPVDVNPTAPGWNFPRVVGFVLALFSMVGFGVCSLCGLVVGGGEAGVLGLVAVGIALTVGSVFWLRAILRRVRSR